MPMALKTESLVDTRVQVHWAAQVADAFGRTHLTADPLWHHVALTYTRDGWTTGRTGDVGARLVLDLVTPALAVTLESGDTTNIPLDGLSLAGLRNLVVETLAEVGIEGEMPLREPSDDMPAHPVATEGARFATDPEAAMRLHDMYAQAAEILHNYAQRHSDAERPYLFPHHFDVALMRTVEKGERAEAEDAKTVTLGFSSGDKHYDEPYWYAIARPDPSFSVHPRLDGGGRWRERGWTGAVLLQSMVTNAGGDVLRFIESANAALEDALRGAP